MPTDYVLLGLVLAIIIVVVLLLSCYKTKPKHERYGMDYRDKNEELGTLGGSGMVFGGGKSGFATSGEDVGEMGKLLGSGGLTAAGTAKLNRDAQKRSDLVSADLVGYDSYNDVIRYQGLENSVFKSHNNWIKDMNHTTSTASMQSERDDLGDMPVTWVGLRRPNFTDHPGIEASARQDASFTADQMPVYRHFVL